MYNCCIQDPEELEVSLKQIIDILFMWCHISSNKICVVCWRKQLMSVKHVLFNTNNIGYKLCFKDVSSYYKSWMQQLGTFDPATVLSCQSWVHTCCHLRLRPHNKIGPEVWNRKKPLNLMISFEHFFSGLFIYLSIFYFQFQFLFKLF